MTLAAHSRCRAQEIEKKGEHRLALSVTLFEVQGSIVADLLAEPEMVEGVEQQPSLKMRGGEVRLRRRGGARVARGGGGGGRSRGWVAGCWMPALSPSLQRSLALLPEGGWRAAGCLP